MADWVGGLVFAAVVLGMARYGWWLLHQVRAYEPHCVYRIPLVDGRVYIGYAKDKDVRFRRHRDYQRPLAEGNPRKWWDLVPAQVREAKPLRMPDEWVVAWHRSKPLAEDAERRLIRETAAAGVTVLANRIKYKTVVEVAGGED